MQLSASFKTAIKDIQDKFCNKLAGKCLRLENKQFKLSF